MGHSLSRWPVSGSFVAFDLAVICAVAVASCCCLLLLLSLVAAAVAISVANGSVASCKLPMSLWPGANDGDYDVGPREGILAMARSTL